MRTASVGEVQKNFGKILESIHSGESVLITRHGRPVARLTALGPQYDVEWPDFIAEAIELPGTPVGDIVAQQREERI